MTPQPTPSHFICSKPRKKRLKRCLLPEILYPKTHDLDELFNLLPSDLSAVLSFREKLLGWTAYAVDMRYDITGYPGKEEMLQALKTAQDLRSGVLALIYYPDRSGSIE